MNRIRMFAMCLLAIMAAGVDLKAQEVTIILVPEWNWISYPNAEAMGIAEALGDFVPLEGDIIKSQYATSTYIRGSWRGGVTHFVPGRGYLYYSSRTEDVEFVFTQPTSSVVATATPTDITATSAEVGGMVMLPEGSHVFLRGVCWGTGPNPTIDDNHITIGTGIGSFSDMLTELIPGTTYYVRAYVVSDYGLAYGNQQSFTTVIEYQYVDLGLPSGTLWATFNVGANAPEEYGDYFAWGETQPKDTYDWNTYQYCMGTDHTFTKYCSNSSYGYNGFTDDLTTLLPEDDAATANWGVGWRMPSKEDWQELLDNTTVTWTTRNGVNGRLFTASNGNSLFLPAAGYRGDSSFYGEGSIGEYWSSSLCFGYPVRAWFLYFNSDGCHMSDYGGRLSGHSVRPVRAGSQNASFFIDATANPAEGGEVSGDGTYQEGAECTLTATANTGYTFANWTENDSVVSTDANYTFVVNADRILVANFTLPSYTISVSASPSIGGSVSGGGTYTEGQSCTVSAIASTNYVFTSWIENGSVVSTDATYTFTVTNNRILVANFNVIYNGREYVDLGLPSGALWATCNVGATTPEGYGNLYSWYYNYGNMPANMPTIEQWRELANNTTGAWTNRNGVNGWLYTASNGNTLFLPAAGYQSGNAIFGRGSEGVYWSKTLTLNSNVYFVLTFNSSFNNNGYGSEWDYGMGCSVRQVLTP